MYRHYNKFYSHYRRWYEHCLKKYPVSTQSVQTGILMGLGDVISQKLIEDKSFKQIEWKRTLQFFGLGTLYVGPMLTNWYGFLERKLHHGTIAITLKKTAFDQFMFAPFFLSSIMIIYGGVQGYSWDENVTRYKSEFFNVLTGNYVLWPGVQLVNFYLVPVHYQVLVVQVVALTWNIFLSWKFHGTKDESKSKDK